MTIGVTLGLALSQHASITQRPDRGQGKPESGRGPTPVSLEQPVAPSHLPAESPIRRSVHAVCCFAAASNVAACAFP